MSSDAPWAQRVDDLAQWIDEHMVNRRDVWGEATPDSRLTRPQRRYRGKAVLTRDILVSHFKGEITIGLHSTSENNRCRWFAVDYDNHGNDKPAQLEIAALLASRRDAALIAPTGFGKSRPPKIVTHLRVSLGLGLTVYLAPLVSLCMDMQRRCIQSGLRTGLWNGTVSPEEKCGLLQKIIAGESDILVITAESLDGQGSLNEQLRTALNGRVGLVWIDEFDTAINDKNFRVKWAKLGVIVRNLNPVVIYACSATCTVEQETELIHRCGLRNPAIRRLGTGRDNLKYIETRRSEETLSEIFQRHKGEKILVYVATVYHARQLVALFTNCGYAVEGYYGPLSVADKKTVQSGFLSGKIKIVIATCAFARGVDIPDIRNIVIFDPPKSIAEFVQQSGRAGRDGLPSNIYVCNHNAEDGWGSQEFLTTGQFPDVCDLDAVWQHLKASPDGITDSQTEIAKTAGVAKWKYGAAAIFRTLSRHGLLEDFQAADVRNYRAVGEFARVDWTTYQAERKAAFQALTDLKSLWARPAAEFRDALASYMDD